MNRIKQLCTAKQANGDGQDKKEEPKKEPFSLSELPDGIYPLQFVGAAFIKNSNQGMTVISLQFIRPDLSHARLDIPLTTVNFGSLIVPGTNQGQVKPVIKLH